jgi:hypothetical protein
VEEEIYSGNDSACGYHVVGGDALGETDDDHQILEGAGFKTRSCTQPTALHEGLCGVSGLVSLAICKFTSARLHSWCQGAQSIPQTNNW